MAPKGLILALLAAATSPSSPTATSAPVVTACRAAKKIVVSLWPWPRRDVVCTRMTSRTLGAIAGCLVSLLLLAVLISAGGISGGLGGGGGADEKTDVLALNKELEYAAIQAVLRHLDDNHDGSVDLQESEEFVQMELKENTEKSHRFHETDSQITSEDLWLSWQQNQVFHWTSAEVVDWLTVYVELPQYTDVFYKLNITGRHLPRLANNTGGILQTLLGVSDSQHKQKLKLRAMDLVLFGPPNGKGSLWKDIVVALSVSLCVVGVAYALRQRRVTQQRIDTFLESYREKERELKALQEMLEEEKETCEVTDGARREEEEEETGKEERDSNSPNKSFTDSSPSPESEVSLPHFSRNSRSLSICSASFDGSLTKAQEEIVILRREVNDLSNQLTSTAISHSLLQSLLQDTCHYERDHVERRRREAQDEITRAQKVCDKIKRRRASLFGTFHLANSSALEEAGLQITKAVNNMQKVSESFEEYHQRWRRIEQVCNFPIISAPAGLTMAAAAPSSSSSPASLPHNTSNYSLKSLTRRDSGDTILRESLSRYSSEGYVSLETNSLSFGDGSPTASLKRGRHSVSGSSSVERETSRSTSCSSLYHHQCSCPSFSSKSGTQTLHRGRSNTLPSSTSSSLPPPTTSLPRNFTVSGRWVTRHDSYNAAVEGEDGCHGDSSHSDRGERRKTGSDSVFERTAGRRSSREDGGGGGGGRRRSSVQRQACLSALHEETSSQAKEEEVEEEPITMTTIPAPRSHGSIRISKTSAHSTV